MRQEEINVEKAMELVNSNQAVFVWIGGMIHTPLTELLNTDNSRIIEANPYDILDNKNQQQILQQKKPIFVCHHGHASYELVRELLATNVKGYSLAGGIAAIKNIK